MTLITNYYSPGPSTAFYQQLLLTSVHLYYVKDVCGPSESVLIAPMKVYDHKMRQISWEFGGCWVTVQDLLGLLPECL